MFRTTEDGERIIVCDTCHEERLTRKSLGELLSLAKTAGWIEYKDQETDHIRDKCPACLSRERCR